MVSAMNRTGHVVIEELSFKIEASEEDETGETRKALERFKSTIDSEEEESPSKKHDDLKVVIPRYI